LHAGRWNDPNTNRSARRMPSPRPPASNPTPQGLNYEVIKPLAKAFALHPLAVEDIVHAPQRVKVDYYARHLYISMILLTLDARDGGAKSSIHSLRTLVPTLRARMTDPSRKNVKGAPAGWRGWVVCGLSAPSSGAKGGAL
jgi:hypothetical protein